jgi:hypothetical protein
VVPRAFDYFTERNTKNLRLKMKRDVDFCPILDFRAHSKEAFMTRSVLESLHCGRTAAALLCALLIVLPAGVLEGASSTDGFHDFASLTRAIKSAAAANPEVATLMSIGKSLKGRDLWLLQISGKGDPLAKQALLIVANLEGDHVIGSEVALGIAESLIKGYGQDEAVTKALDSRTFYILPRLNPDGAEAFFADVKHEGSGNLNPRDDDYDWLVDEDGPEDLNSDGKITLMRVKDKEGDWCVDEKDPRLMKRKKADTPLDKLYKLYTEGVDDDGDELFNEDGPGGFNINRNFPHNFGYKLRGFKVYAASEPETQALIDFMTRYDSKLKTQPHKNICGVLIFSKFDNLAAGSGIECGTPVFPEVPAASQAASGFGGGMMMFRMGGRRGQQADAPQARPVDPAQSRSDARDKSIFDKTGEEYKKITKITSAVSEKPFGSFLEYAYFQYGVPAFSANLWSLREEARPGPRMPQRGTQAAGAEEAAQGQRAQASQRPQAADRAAMMQRFMSRTSGASARTGGGDSETDAKWLKWIDEKNEGKGFIPWTQYSHKQLGEVEIGGFEPFLRINPTADQIPGLVKSHTEFSLYLASRFAEIVLDAPKVERLNSNLYRVTVKVHNIGKFPYASAQGARARSITAILVRLGFEDDAKMELFGGTKRVDIDSLGPDEEREVSWMIISPPGKKIDVKLWARSGGGTAEASAVLR